MMKKIFTGIALIIVSLAFAREKDTIKPWNYSAETSVTFSQILLTNWAAGGQSSVSGNGFINLFANYKKGKSIWENKIELAYGLMKQGEEDVRKTNDKMYLSSVYGLKASKKWYYSASLTFQSQFAEGYDYPNDSVIISNFLAPGYIMGALGMQYKPGDHFGLFISPASGRLIIVNDDNLSEIGAFGVDKGKKTRLKFGGSIKFEFIKEIMTNVSFTNNLQLFTNYLEHPQNIDIQWDVMINMKINDYLSANISTSLIYDHDIMITDKDGNTGPRTQFKELFGVGFSHKFQTK